MKSTTSSRDTHHASSPSDASPDEARFKRANRRQVEMITLSLNQRLDIDHRVRAVWAFVEQLDLAGIAEFSNAGCRNRGLYPFAVRGLEKVKCETLWQVLAVRC